MKRVYIDEADYTAIELLMMVIESIIGIIGYIFIGLQIIYQVTYNTKLFKYVKMLGIEKIIKPLFIRERNSEKLFVIVIMLIGIIILYAYTARATTDLYRYVISHNKYKYTRNLGKSRKSTFKGSFQNKEDDSPKPFLGHYTKKQIDRLYIAMKACFLYTSYEFKLHYKEQFDNLSNAYLKGNLTNEIVEQMKEFKNLCAEELRKKVSGKKKETDNQYEEDKFSEDKAGKEEFKEDDTIASEEFIGDNEEGGYFKNCTTYQELRIRYKKLAARLHPDNPNGDSDKFKNMSLEYEELVKIYSKK